MVIVVGRECEEMHNLLVAMWWFIRVASVMSMISDLVRSLCVNNGGYV
jgi:hypothetical protein